MQDPLHELHSLLDLLRLEKQKVFEEFQAYVQRLPERVAEGYAWHPVEVEKSGYAYGERAYTFERKVLFTCC